MAINRFDTPAQAQFVNTYVPIPFEDILNAGLTKQRAYDTNLGNFESAQAQAEQLKYIPGSVDEDYIKNVVIPTFESVSDEYLTRDISDPVVVREINKKIKTSIDRERVRRIQDSYQNYRQYQSNLYKLGLEGKTAPYLNQFNPSTFSSEYDIFDKIPESTIDFGKEAENYFNQLRDTHLGYNRETGELISGVTPNIVSDVSKANLAEFMISPAGMQAIKAMKYQGDPRSDTEIAYDVLYSRGMEFVRKNLGFAPGSGSSRATQESIIPEGTIYSSGLSLVGNADKSRKIKNRINKLEDYGDFSTTYVDSEGKQLGTLKIIDNKFNKFLSTFDPTSTYKESDMIKKIETKSDKDSVIYEGLLKRTRNYFGKNKFDNKSNDEKIDLINDYLKDYQTRALYFPEPEILSPEESKILNNQLLGKDEKGNRLVSGRTWYDPSEGGVSSKVDYKTISNKYPPSKYEYYISRRLQPQNPIFSYGYNVDIYDEEGKIVDNVYMSGTEEEQAANSFEHNLWNSMYANPSGIINLKDQELGISLKGFMESDDKITLQVYDANDKKLGNINLNNQENINTNQVIDELINLLKFVDNTKK